MASIFDFLEDQNSYDPYADLEALLGGGGGAGLLDDLSGGSDVAALPAPQLDEPPMLSTDPGSFMDLIDMIQGRIGGAYDFDMPFADTALIDSAPQAATSQFGISPELQSYLSGEGFTPQQLSLMRTQAREAPAMAGQQQLGQMRRMLGQAGIEGPAAAAYMGDVARNVGYAQNQNLQNVALQNAQQGAANKMFGIGQQSQIGLTNMQQANMMALQNANLMFQALRENQQAQNSMNQFNTGNQVNQQMQRAGQQGSYAANAGNQTQQQIQEREMENANKQWGQELQQTQYDWNSQLLPWQEMNQRYGQAVGTLGSWGQ